MGRSYKQLSLEDRCEIARLSANGHSVRQIAAALDRPPSTISREMNRNRGVQVGYKPSYAQQQTPARRWKGSRLEREAELRRTVLAGLGRGWSPEQVAGRLARQHRRKVISHESIYRFIYAQIARTSDFSWRNYLPRRKAKRGRRGKRGGSPASFIAGRVSLDQRPIEVADRKTPGHWEADLMMFSKYGQQILAVHERTSRILLGDRLDSKLASGVASHLVRLFAALPQPMRRTVTFDNGTEFASHLSLQSLLIQTFFCDPHSPWQKGGIENAIGRMRRFTPRKTDLETLPTRRLRQAFGAYNNTPRKCPDFRTPAEAFAAQVLHFECESTSWLSPGRRRVCGAVVRHAARLKFSRRPGAGRDPYAAADIVDGTRRSSVAKQWAIVVMGPGPRAQLRTRTDRHSGFPSGLIADS
ncbi:IS30 family transposase [Bradyrhizobium sp. CCBAU 53421]|uniref:IS30 family transposase n=1 Tax=Bradyrhizobium sp. CCBAU 53421 TaxID=1325120 RepID=UPI001FEF7ED4|nr:IS30 family transposase [Bradyrhizobium sp. CCBAU 53421]